MPHHQDAGTSHLEGQRKCGVLDSVFSLTVSAVGAGILVIPFSFRCTGLLGGVLLLGVILLVLRR